jgi:hypothetical protein
MFLLILEGELFVTKQHKASKDTFSLIHLVFQSNSGPIFIYQKHVTQGRGEGVERVPKKCII